MKKFISAVLCISILFSILAASQITSSAETVKLTVPKIEINTANGNGTSLQKEDGYTGASVKISLDGQTEAEDSIIIKVRGNSTAMTSKKSFTFKFEKKKNLFNMGSGKKWVLLANAFDPTFLRNYIAFDFAKELGLDYTSKQKFCELWLDGRFRGCYTLMEPVQEGKDRVNINIDGNNDFMLEYERTRVDDGTTYITSNGGLRFGISEPDEPEDEQVDYITETVNRCEGIIKNGSREEIESAIDVSSFVRFYILNEFIKTNDFNFSSVYFYYKDGKLYAGPPWDYDLTMGNVNKDFSANSASAFKTDGIYISDKLFYKYLCAKPWFTAAVRREYTLHLDYINSISADGGLIDTLEARYRGIFDRNYKEAGWSIRYLINVMMYPLPTYDENLAFLKSWAGKRAAWLESYYDVKSLFFIKGDTDGNGTINIADVTCLQKLLTSNLTDEKARQRGSVLNEKLSVNDATEIQKYLAKINCSALIGTKDIY